MGWAVILLPDERGDAAARRVWSATHHAGFRSRLYDGDNQPHVSLAVLETQDGSLDGIVQAFAQATAPARAVFAAAGSFGEDVIYLSPEPAAALLRMNRDLVGRLGPLASLMDRHYLPGEFQPHLTVAFHVPEGQFTRAWNTVRDSFAPFSTTFARIAVVKFHPVKIMATYDLQGE